MLADLLALTNPLSDRLKVGPDLRTMRRRGELSLPADPCRRPRRRTDRGAGRVAEPTVRSGQGEADGLSRSDVPGVVAGEVVPQRPHPPGKRGGAGKALCRAAGAVAGGLGLGGLGRSGPLRPPQDVAGLRDCHLPAGEGVLGHQGFRSLALGSGVDQGRHPYGSLHEHRRLRSRYAPQGRETVSPASPAPPRAREPLRATGGCWSAMRGAPTHRGETPVSTGASGRRGWQVVPYPIGNAPLVI